MSTTTDRTTQARIERLGDESQVRELLARYATAVDRWDMELLSSCYHPGAVDEHGAFNGRAEDYVPGVESLGSGRHAWGWHLLGTTFVDVEANGQVAWAETYALSASRMLPVPGQPEGNRVVPVRYCDRHENRGGEWRIAHRIVVYEPGRIAPIGAEPQLGPHHRRGTKDPTDLAYEAHRHTTHEDGLQPLLDESAIRALLARTAFAIDTQDFELVASALDPQAVIEYGPDRWDGRGFVDHLGSRGRARLDYSISFLANQRLVLSGDSAWVETYSLELTRAPAANGRPAQTSVLPMRLWDRLRHRDDRWRIVSRRVMYETGRTDPVVTETPGARHSERLDRPAAAWAGARTLDELEAEATIRRVLAQLARAADRGDRELLLACYHADAVDERDGRPRSPDQLAEHLRNVLWRRTEWSMQFLGNILIAVDGNAADVETYCLELSHHPATGELPRRDTIRPVRYLDRFESRGGNWRIASRRVFEETGRIDQVGVVVDLSPNHRRGRRDHTDPTYMRLHERQRAERR